MKQIARWFLRFCNRRQARLHKRWLFDNKGHNPRWRIWFYRKAMDVCDRIIYRGVFNDLQERVERHEKLARDVYRFHQETIANVLLWGPVAMPHKGGAS